MSYTVNVNSCFIWDCGHSDNSLSTDRGIGGIGIASNGTGGTKNLNVHNTVVLGCSAHTFGNDYNEQTSAGTITWNIDYSFDSDNSIASRDTGAVSPLANVTITDGTPTTGNYCAVGDITTSPFDLRLVSHADNDAQDYHSSTTGAGLTTPSTDIIGTSRPQNTNYDVGPFEITAGGPAPTGVGNKLLLMSVG